MVATISLRQRSWKTGIPEWNHAFWHSCDKESPEEAILDYKSKNPGMTMEIVHIDVISERDKWAAKLPKELFEWADLYAYEQGHAYGEDEVDLILRDIARGLHDALEKFLERTSSGGKVDVSCFSSKHERSE